MPPHNAVPLAAATGPAISRLLLRLIQKHQRGNRLQRRRVKFLQASLHIVNKDHEVFKRMHPAGGNYPAEHLSSQNRRQPSQIQRQPEITPQHSLRSVSCRTEALPARLQIHNPIFSAHCKPPPSWYTVLCALHAGKPPGAMGGLLLHHAKPALAPVHASTAPVGMPAC